MPFIETVLIDEEIDMKVLLRKSALAAALLSASALGQAAIVGEESDNTFIEVGAVGSAGGVGVQAFVFGTKVPFSHFTSIVPDDANNVYQFTGWELVNVYGAPPGPDPQNPIPGPDHSVLGIWAVKKVGDHDLHFGEWYGEGAPGVRVPNTHTVFYVGENGNVASTLPASATYTVETIGNYINDSSPLPTSTFNATFGSTNTVTATVGSNDIQFTSGAITVSGGNVALNASGVSVASTSGIGGNLRGQFFGTGADAVAGIVTFSGDRDRDVAFGGLKN